MPEVGEAIPELVRVVTAADVKAYADAGGDQNPLHQDDGFARRLGFPGVIAHGMFTMGQMAAAVAAFAGDPSAVREISAQFRTTVLMGEEIVAGGTVVAVDGDTATIDTWVRLERDGETLWPIKKGRAVIAIA
jgi:acyl dehydratase